MNRPDFTVATLGELATLYTAEIAEGANVWVAAEGDYWTLEKNSGAIVDADVVAPGAGAPTAGATNARWLRQAGSAAVKGWIAVPTLAALAALPGPTINNELFFVLETNRPYDFVAGSVAVVNGYTILAPTGGVPGRFILSADSIDLRPIDGVADDAPRLQAATAALALLGGSVQLLPGFAGQQWRLLTPVDLSTIYGAHIIGSSQTRGTCNIPANGVLGSPFVANVVRQAGTVDGTLNANVVVGSKTLVVNKTTVPIVGNALMVYQGLYNAQIYDIVSVAGAVAPFTVTVDHPVMFPFTAVNSTVKELSNYPRYIQLEMRGMTWSGIADRGVEILGGLHCTISDMGWDTVDGFTRNSGIFAMDVGSRSPKVTRCFADLTGATSIAGVSCESLANGVIEDCVIKNTTYVGYLLMDGIGTIFRGCVAEACANGYAIVVNPGADGVGAYDTIFEGCSAYACTGAGCSLQQSRGVFLSNCAFTYCVDGLDINAGVLGTRISNLDLSGSSVYCVSSAADWTASNVKSVNLPSTNSSNGKYFIQAGKVRVDGLEISAVVPGGDFAVGIHGGDVSLRNVDIALNDAGSYGFWIDGGVARIEDVSITGTHVFGVRATGGSVNVGANFLDAGTGVVLTGGAATAEQYSGVTSKSVTGADVTLTFTEAQATGLTTTGVLGAAHALIVPTIAGMTWDVFCNNTGAFATTFKTTAGTGIVVAQGKRARLMCDGTNVVRVTADV